MNWRCRDCGNSNEIDTIRCDHCGSGRQIPASLKPLQEALVNCIQGPNNGVVYNQPVFNTNIYAGANQLDCGTLESEDDDYDMPQYDMPQLPQYAGPVVKERGFLMSLFLLGCNVMLWLGILSMSSLIAFCFWLVFAAFSKH